MKPIETEQPARWPRLVAASVVIIVASGCGDTRGEPITVDTATSALVLPDAAGLRVATATIHHPLLRPVAVDLDAALTPDAVALLAVALQPDLRAIRRSRDLARAQIVAAGLLPNPQINVGVDQPFAGADTATAYGLGLSWDVTALIGRGARRRAAEQEAGSVDLDIAWQEWQVAQQARLRFYAMLAAQARAEATRTAYLSIAQWRDEVEFAGAGRLLTAADVATARTAEAGALLSQLDAANEVEQKRLALARIIGAPTGWRPHLDQTAWPTAVPDATGLAEGIEDRRLDLAALRLGYESQEATLRAAVLSRFPKTIVSLNHARDPAAVQTIGPAVAIDVPLFDRNQAAIARELATRERLRDEYVARVFAARHDLASALAEAQTQAQRIVAADRAAAGADQRAAALADAVAMRMTDRATAMAAALEAAHTHEEALASRQRMVELRIAIESASGCYLPDPGAVQP